MSDPQTSVRRVRGCMSAAHGMLTMIGAAAEMLAAFLVMNLLRTVAREGEVEPAEFAAWMLDHPAAVAAMAIPAMLVGLFAVVRPTRSPLVLIAIESILLLVPFVAILYAFLAVIGPLYQFEPI